MALLIWTTTPWTLVSNTAAAVNPAVAYVVARTAAGELLIVAAARREQVLGADSEVLTELRGEDLVGTAYRRPFDWVAFPATDAPVHTVLAADYVTTEDGTGIVHEAPAFGAEDFALCRANGLPIVNPVGTNGGSTRTCRWSAACSSRPPTRRWSPSWPSEDCCSPAWSTPTPTRTAGVATRR